MINLEIPLTANQDLHLASGLPRGSIDVEDCGNTGPVGRFAWYIPTGIVNHFKGQQVNQPPPDHWRLFTKPEWTTIFDQDVSQFAKYTRDLKTKDFFCKKAYCVDGVHTPDQCQQNAKGKAKCATLLADKPENTEFVVKQISALKLFVRVVWVGPHLEMLAEQFADSLNLSGSPKAVVALSWHPGALTARKANKYTTVSFPACEPDDPSPAWPCYKLTLHRFVKVAWRPLKDNARVAYEAVHRFQLNSTEYEAILAKIPNESPIENYEGIACEWMRANYELWRNWVPNDDSERTKIYIGGIFPMGGDVYTARGIMAAAWMAITAVNNDTRVLRDYSLQLHAFDGKCQADTVMKSFIDYIRLPYYKQIAGILGPACSDTVEPLAGVSRHYKTVIISYSAEGSSFSDREKYPYFFRTIGENKQYKYVYLNLLEKLRWKRVAALTEDGQKYTEYISHMQDYMQQNGIVFVANRKFPRERGELAMSQYLEDLKSKSARIIIADVYDDAARTVMCEAYRQKMTSKQGYVWFLPLWLQSRWYDTDHFNKRKNETIQCTTAQMIEAINGHLALTHAYYAPDSDAMQEGMSVGDWKNKYEQKCKSKKVEMSNYGGYAYDAVWTYAYALDKLFHENQSYAADLHTALATKSFVKHLSDTDFNGVSGHIKFRNGPSRVSVIHVVQWLNNSTYIVGSFEPNVSESKGEIIGGRLDLNITALRWLSEDGKMPDDGTEPPPSCFVAPIADFFNSSCETAIIIANLLGFIIVSSMVFIVFFYMKRRYERQAKKYMQSMGIDLLPSASSLDKWEIPREDVVVNRKLGEGAFGTVYGGEANLADKGWVAVAVKTLKMGSTTEVKLDFLSEAEVMKRLDHQNIVRLLGVCTKNEPVYTIMEFMLYGDLKTFLLARRHLVTERGSEENEEISSKKLTNMALDVARALTYLADLKYVHRDVACRNCMVNANRIVKLGDFGMTRAMYESDYYKFNRKGMLPVRWMAPESLGLGIFTPNSDIWSYGVLLYEIITFGSFPFQGMSNSQVLEFVKNGNTLTIPKGVKPNLEMLLRACWAQDYKKRINASEVVEFLANNPRLIAPCLDVPLASVQMEDTAQLELNLPEKSRKCSVSLNKNRQRSLSGGGAATTPNSPTSTFDAEPKLSRSATSHDVQYPLIPGPPSSGPRYPPTSAAPPAPDTVPLLPTQVVDQPPSFSVNVPMLPPPPRPGDFIENGGAYMTPRRLPINKFNSAFPTRRKDDAAEFTSVL
ncbi:receptor-type guanylate cyclase gcy-19-like isoform X2 [Neocloeon triangulifer]|nr:receptor-type guanylate cyclase gcy-19-like isoform X2 [Neocloeon triangulifer]